MRFEYLFICFGIIILGLTETSISKPAMEKKSSIENISNRITTATLKPQKDPEEATTISPQTVRFVPLITLLTGFFTNFFKSLGTFNGINTFSKKRQLGQSESQKKNETESQLDIDLDVVDESELIECDASHLGLWPDKSNNQRYYKCEMDPRSESLSNCLQDYYLLEVKENSTGFIPIKQVGVPTAKPCFLLTLMKCVNGFKYSHKNRICIPDIVFGSLS